MTSWNTPSILDVDRTGDAVAHLRDYFRGTNYAGSYFERLGGGGDREETADLIASDDLLALSMLSVPVDGHAARSLLDGSTAVNALLREIPRDASILTSEGRALLEEGGPMIRLWKELRKLRTFGPVRTSKLIARKRPHLVPVYDRVVAAQFGASDDADQWRAFGRLFSKDALVGHLRDLRNRSEVGDDISLLRTLDVVVWMEGKGGKPEAVAVLEE